MAQQAVLYDIIHHDPSVMHPFDRSLCPNLCAVVCSLTARTGPAVGLRVVWESMKCSLNSGLD